MFAVIEDGSRQYRVQEGETLTVDFRADSKPGDTVAFDRVLLANGGGESVVGRPLIDGAVVETEIVEPEFKGPKIEVQKIRRRKNSRRHTGHRQKHTTVLVKTITVPGLEIVTPKDEPAPEAEQESESQTPSESEAAESEPQAETADSEPEPTDEEKPTEE